MIKGKFPFDAKFFKQLAKDVVPMFRKHTFMDALDVKGKKFKRYSDKYGEAKRTGSLFRQASEFKDSTAPVLTSDLLRDWKLQGTSSTGFTFGTATQGGKIVNLKRLGRVISTDKEPLPKKISKHIIKQADKYVQARLNKIKGGKFNI
tara:strand:- start:4180 stop:4623 length:444 start_codon:yes stop_codon:yes gene_type:complete